MNKMSNEYSVTNSDLVKGGKDFEVFWLRPKKMANTEAILKMRVNQPWGGWKLKDGLVESLGLEVGDTINTEVTVLNGPGLIENADDTDLFASGAGADWLLDNDIGQGSIFEAKVKFVYAKAPVGGLAGRDVWKLSLVFIEGYGINRGRYTQDEQGDSIESPEDIDWSVLSKK